MIINLKPNAVKYRNEIRNRLDDIVHFNPDIDLDHNDLNYLEELVTSIASSIGFRPSMVIGDLSGLNLNKLNTIRVIWPETKKYTYNLIFDKDKVTISLLSVDGGIENVITEETFYNSYINNLIVNVLYFIHETKITYMLDD